MHIEISNKLIGYKQEIDFFVNLYKNNKLPKVILLNGESGIGKYTFLLHLIYFLENNREYKENNTIESEIIKNPNILILKKNHEDSGINIDQVKKLISFTKLKSFNNNNKFVIIREISDLNVNSLNSLLKILEEPSGNIFIFLTNDILFSITPTLKSRCFEKKMFLNQNDSNEIINYLTSMYEINNYQYDLVKTTPGRYLRKYLFLKEHKLLNTEIIYTLENLDYKKIEKDQNLQFILSEFLNKYQTDIDFLNKIKINLNLKNDLKTFLINKINL